MLKLYENIKNLRKENGWSQDELARRTGYTDRSSIAKIESGKVDLPQSKIMDFANVFGVDPGDLMGWEDEPSQKSPEELKEELKEALSFNLLLNELTTEEQEEVREIVKLLLSLPRYERQFLHDWLTNHGKQP